MQVDSVTGRATSENFVYAFSGKIRQQVRPDVLAPALYQ